MKIICKAERETDDFAGADMMLLGLDQAAASRMLAMCRKMRGAAEEGWRRIYRNAAMHVFAVEIHCPEPVVLIDSQRESLDSEMKDQVLEDGENWMIVPDGFEPARKIPGELARLRIYADDIFLRTQIRHSGIGRVSGAALRFRDLASLANGTAPPGWRDRR